MCSDGLRTWPDLWLRKTVGRLFGAALFSCAHPSRTVEYISLEKIVYLPSSLATRLKVSLEHEQLLSDALPSVEYFFLLGFLTGCHYATLSPEESCSLVRCHLKKIPLAPLPDEELATHDESLRFAGFLLALGSLNKLSAMTRLDLFDLLAYNKNSPIAAVALLAMAYNSNACEKDLVRLAKMHITGIPSDDDNLRHKSLQISSALRLGSVLALGILCLHKGSNQMANSTSNLLFNQLLLSLSSQIGPESEALAFATGCSLGLISLGQSDLCLSRKQLDILIHLAMEESATVKTPLLRLKKDEKLSFATLCPASSIALMLISFSTNISIDSPPRDTARPMAHIAFGFCQKATAPAIFSDLSASLQQSIISWNVVYQLLGRLLRLVLLSDAPLTYQPSLGDLCRGLRSQMRSIACLDWSARNLRSRLGTLLDILRCCWALSLSLTSSSMTKEEESLQLLRHLSESFSEALDYQTTRNFPHCLAIVLAIHPITRSPDPKEWTKTMGLILIALLSPFTENCRQEVVLSGLLSKLLLLPVFVAKETFEIFDVSSHLKAMSQEERKLAIQLMLRINPASISDPSLLQQLFHAIKQH